MLRLTTSWALVRLPRYSFRPARGSFAPICGIRREPSSRRWKLRVQLLLQISPTSQACKPQHLAVRWCRAHATTWHFFGATGYSSNHRPFWRNLLVHISPLYRCPYGRRKAGSKLMTEAYSIIDSCTGFHQPALLRWRLCPDEWRLQGTTLISPRATIEIDCNQPISRLEMVIGWESHHYGTKTPLPVLEVSVDHAPVTFTTSIQLYA